MPLPTGMIAANAKQDTIDEVEFVEYESNTERIIWDIEEFIKGCEM